MGKIIIIIIYLCSICSLRAGSFEYPDFAVSMLRNNQKMEKEYLKMNPKLVEAFKRLYEENIATEEETEENRIPKIVHQIWLGGPVPGKYREWMAAWASLEGWQYYLWTDKEVKSLKLYNQDLYDMSTNYGEKSDILRLELLEKFGGVYVDVDYQCVNIDVFEHLNKHYDLYIGFEPLEHGIIGRSNIFKLCNALMASVKHHPLMQHLVTNMKANYLAYRPFAGPFQTSGPSYITRVICEYMIARPDRYRNMYLPCTFLYPLTEKEIVVENRDDIWPETAGIHYWSGSWHPQKQLYVDGGQN